MKLTKACFFSMLILAFIFTSCNKEKVETPTPQQELKITDIKMPTLSGKNIVRPEIPPYTGGDTETADARAVIQVSPGTNQLQDIINGANNNATIRLLAGTHTEDATLVINHKIKLTGVNGAVLSLNGDFGLLVSDASGTKITDLEIVNGSTSLLAIGVENSNQVEIKNNHISGFLHTIALEQANHAKIMSNTIVGTDPGNGLGVSVINGDHVNINGNDISINLFGIWACDKKGKCINNTTHNNFVGIILCKVPDGTFPLGTGTGGSEFPGNQWNVTNNTSNDNFWGYMVIDGANNNTLSNNSADNNAVVDMELFTDSFLFGFLTPASHDNKVNIGGTGITVVDCGNDNVVHGGTPLPGPCN